jgi:predicted ATP-grasp superfamily ATP-dependent carboligase
VLVTNAEERCVLAACRDLHEGGYEVTASSFTRIAPARWSRATARGVVTSDARANADAFVDGLRRELASRPYVTLMVGSDSALLALARGREQLEGLTNLGLPPTPVVERALSREALAEAARHVGMRPATSIKCSEAEHAVAAGRRLGFPLIVKSTDGSQVLGQVAVGLPKGQVIASEPQLIARARTFPDGFLVQDLIPGDLFSFGGVIAGGSLAGVAVSRYFRTWPPHSGSVSFSETRTPPEGLEDQVGRLLAMLGWEGIFELELIRAESGEFVPIDLNPRPYGSMALASAAGAPLPTIWSDWLARGERPPVPVRARPGCLYRWADADLRHAGWQLRHGQFRAAIAPLRPRRAVTHAHFRDDDPLPLLARALYLGRVLFKRPFR